MLLAVVRLCFRRCLAGFTHFIRLLPVQSLLRCFGGYLVGLTHFIRFLPLQSLLTYFRGSLAGITHFIRLLPVQSLLRCFKGSHIRFLHSTVLRCLGYIARLRFTLRWEGMAASTNCSSNVNCCATLRTYLAQFVVHREQRSTLTEERNSRTACSSKVN